MFECLALYVTPMIHGWEIKWVMVDIYSVVNVCSRNILQQLQDNHVTFSPLEKVNFLHKGL